MLEQVIRTGANVASTQADLNITRISVSTYATIPNKLVSGRPIQVWIQRYSGERNSITGKLTSTINASVTSIELTSVDGLPAFGYIDIGSETVFYQYISGTTLGGCARGQNGTTASSHLDTTITLYWNQLPAITVWPTPDNSQTYTFAYWRMRRVQDAGSGVQIADMNFRFLPALTAGLAYHIAVKVPELMDRVPMLKQMYDEAYETAAGEDREKAAVRFVPRQMFIGGGTP